MAAPAAAAQNLRASVLGGYRRLMRLRKQVFAGDQFAIEQARHQLRLEFLRNKDVQDANMLQGLLRGIEEVEEMFAHNIVQGKLNDQGNYEVKLRPEQHLQGKEHEEVAHVDDRLVNKTVVVESTKGSKGGAGKEEGSGCCGGGGGGVGKH